MDRGDAAANLRADRNENDAVLCDGRTSSARKVSTTLVSCVESGFCSRARSIVPSFTSPGTSGTEVTMFASGSPEGFSRRRPSAACTGTGARHGFNYCRRWFRGLGGCSSSRQERAQELPVRALRNAAPRTGQARSLSGRRAARDAMCPSSARVPQGGGQSQRRGRRWSI